MLRLQLVMVLVVVVVVFVVTSGDKFFGVALPVFVVALVVIVAFAMMETQTSPIFADDASIGDACDSKVLSFCSNTSFDFPEIKCYEMRKKTISSKMILLLDLYLRHFR